MDKGWQLATNPTPRESPWITVLFSLVVVVYCVWLLSLPVFPSQDGPLHLYYTDVFRHFLDHRPGLYGRYYRVGSYLPPYALYYYLLLLLGKVVPLTTADKLVACCSILLTAFGFRWLAKRVGPGGHVAAFLLLPVLLNWPLVMGFLNYTLCCGLGLWAAGLWARFDDSHTRIRQVGFVALLYLMTITHPVPLALLLVGCGVDLLVRSAGMLFDGRRESAGLGAISARFVCLLAALPAMLYIRKFTSRHVLEQAEHLSLHRKISDDLFNYLHGTGLLIFSPGSAGAVLYRTGVGCLTGLALGLAGLHAVRCWRMRRMDAPSLWLVVAIFSMLSLPLIPHDLNGSHFFAWRLIVPVYMFVALAATGLALRSTRIAATVVVCSVFLSVLALWLAAQKLGTIARHIAVLSSTSATLQPGQMGEIVQVGKGEDTDVTYRPFLWAGAHYFREHGLVLYNSAWLDLPVLTLKRNEEENLLEATATQDAPRLSDPPSLFFPGAKWNPKTASFFFLELITPPLHAGRHAEDWQHLTLPMDGASIAGCQPEQWFCIANRR